MFLIALVSVILVFYSVYRDSVEISRNELFSLKTKAISVLIDDALSRALKDADDFEYRYPVVAFLADQSDAQTKILLFSKTSDFLIGNDRLSALTILDRNGQPKLHVGASDPVISELSTLVLSETDVTQKSKLYIRDDGIYVASTIRKDGDHQGIGYLIFQFNMKTLKDNISHKYSAEKIEGSHLLVRMNHLPIMVYKDKSISNLDSEQVIRLIEAHEIEYKEAEKDKTEGLSRAHYFEGYYVFDYHSVLLDIETYFLVSKDTYWHGIQELMGYLLLVLVVVILVSIDVIFLIANRITTPLKNLMLATRDIGKLDGKTLVSEPDRKDEIGQLRQSFIILQQRIESLISRDALTGVYNRHYFVLALERELVRSQRENSPISVMMIDADYFKKINDTYGHAAGDSVLQELSNILDDSVRQYDVVSRIGGEEFTVILPATSVDDATLLGERIRLAVEAQEFRFQQYEFSVTVSIGVCGCACSYRQELTADMLMQCADNMLYDAKRGGRNMVVTATEKQYAAIAQQHDKLTSTEA